ncbi:thiamine pyrophosphokinase [Jannaschia seosinensis]|uniref:Thiamine diphosphokinase n=1 Tax=Jannaschia seosinensis TaxID=313367 RepID=A0A0M7BD30_9RHOB|nr:thiamine diphosphokinase [Jannaschia seosinensis]CUH40301.1 thiamine pyrophosphokinase [Jannaschia seosinensis]
MPFSRNASGSGKTASAGAQTIVGGAPVSSRVLSEALTLAPRLIAVDSGADTCLAAGHVPEAVVGDLDSISQAARIAFADRLHPIPEQDSTDFAKALRTFPAPLTLAVGFIGARSDHFLACLSALARIGERCVLLSETDCVTLCPRAIALDLAAGTRVSLWPLAPVRGTSAGLFWPIDGLELSPTGRVGTSNVATGPVRLTLDGPTALILPADCLRILVESLDAVSRPGGPVPL